jgi:hypothetical protein
MNLWQRLLHRRKMEEQLEKELCFHLEQHTNELIAQGHFPDEARRQARLALGGPEQVKEHCREARGTRWLEDLLQDFRYAVRTLRNQTPRHGETRRCGMAHSWTSNLPGKARYRLPSCSWMLRASLTASRCQFGKSPMTVCGSAARSNSSSVIERTSPVSTSR